MPKPTLQEYQEAIQRPDLCFNDSDLKKGKPIPGVFGLPKVISGGFAGVFQVKRGKKSFAARCFLRDVQDIEKRYKVIHNFLKRKRIPYFVKFQYIDQGILVKGKWYPILKMEWLEGQTLGEYVERNRNNSQTMEDMAQKFKKMAVELKKRGISHCDLHDQNIMVVGGELKIIDYDAMFVPGLEGFQSSEVGHTNYQHPERRLTDFGPHIDNFSEWVIYISLTALSIRPEIWEEVKGGDQCLIFRSRDYSDLERSKAFYALENTDDDNLKLLVDTFKDAIYTYNLEDVPSIMDEKGIVQRRRKLISEVAKIPQISMDGFEVNILQRDKTWIWDNKEIEHQGFKKNLGPERLALILTLIYILAVEGLYIFNQTPVKELTLYASGIPVLALLIPLSYHSREIVRKRNQKASRVKKLEAKIKSKHKKIHREIENVNQIKENANRKITRLKDEIVSLRNQEALELKKVESNHWNKLRLIEEAKKDLKTQEKNEKYHLLKDTQRNYIANKLSGHKVSGSRVPGIGIVKRFILSRSGIRTAADFTDVSIKKTFLTGHGARFRLKAGGTVSVGWITPAQVNSLRRWRAKLEERYESSAPSKLSPDQEKKIKKKYRLQKDKLGEDEKKVKAEIQDEKNTVKDGFGMRYDSLKAEVEESKKHHDSEVGDARKVLASVCDEIEKIDWEVNSLEHQLQGYESITFTNYMKEILSG